MFSLRFHQLEIRLVDAHDTADALDVIRRARFRIVQFSTTTLHLPAHDYIIAGAWYHHRLVAVLVATRVSPEIAWVRACAIDSISMADHDTTVRALARHLMTHAPVTRLFYSGDQFDAWLANMLMAEGFIPHGDIVTFMTSQFEFPPHQHPAILRPLVLGDLQAVRAIDAHVFDAQWQKSLFEVHELFQGDGIRLAALIDTQIVGYAIALWHDQHTTLHLVRIATLPDYQRQGIAYQLLTTIMEYAGRYHAQRMTLNTQHDNTPAHALYLRLGFRQIGEIYHVISSPTAITHH